MRLNRKSVWTNFSCQLVVTAVLRGIGSSGIDVKEEQVAQGQCVVSDTRCPACMIVKWSERKQGSGPEQTWNLPSQAWNLPSQAWNPPSQALNLWGQISGLRGPGGNGRRNERMNESPPVFYRTSSPSGPLPCFLSLHFTIMQAGQQVWLTTYCPWATFLLLFCLWAILFLPTFAHHGIVPLSMLITVI